MTEEQNKTEETPFEFDPAIFLSSSELVKRRIEAQMPRVTKQTIVATDQENLDPRMKDPIFRKLAEPILSPLRRENRARLQMQSPHRLYFYWSIKQNPFQTLQRAFSGIDSSYVLILKLLNQHTGAEEIFQVGPEGNWWFDVKPNNQYRAEVGFYASNRPYIRILYSNSVETPRQKPSQRADYTSSFSVGANQFAQVLDASGYRRDAFDVAIAGEDTVAADRATAETYSVLTRNSAIFDSEELNQIRFALYALGSGYSVDEIADNLAPRIFELVKRDFAGIGRETVMDELKKNFDIFDEIFFDEEKLGEAVIGASIVNFPRSLKLRHTPKSLAAKTDDLKNLDSISSHIFQIER